MTIPEEAGPMIITPMVTVIKCTLGGQHLNLAVVATVEDQERDQVHPRCIPRIQRRHPHLSPTDTPDTGKLYYIYQIVLNLDTFTIVKLYVPLFRISSSGVIRLVAAAGSS